MNNTEAFDNLTERFARTNEANAFVVSQLAHHHLRSDDPELLAAFLAPRKSIPRSVRALVTKAAIAPLDSSFGVAPSGPFSPAFIGQVARVAPLGLIGGLTVSAAIRGLVQISNASASWVGQGASKPVTAMTFAAAGLYPLKLVAQIVVSDELADLSSPVALQLVTPALISASAAAEAVALLDPASSAVPNVRPASLTAGLTPIAPVGDLQDNVGQVLDAISGGDPTRPVLIMTLGNALRLRNLKDLAALGVRLVISSAAGSSIIAIDADGLLVTEFGIEIQRGTPDVEMDSEPDSPLTAATVLTSTWQANLSVLRVERWVNWTVRPGAVATLTLAA